VPSSIQPAEKAKDDPKVAGLKRPESNGVGFDPIESPIAFTE